MQVEKENQGDNNIIHSQKKENMTCQKQTQQ